MNNIRDLRQRMHMTQDEFAEFCGVSRISIARYDTGGKVNSTNAAKIAAACNVSVAYVLGIEDPNSGKEDSSKKMNSNIYLVARGMEKMTEDQQTRMVAMAKAAFPDVFEEGKLK